MACMPRIFSQTPPAKLTENWREMEIYQISKGYVDLFWSIFFSWLCSLLYLAVYRSHNVEPWITSNITSKCNCSPSISPTLYIQTPIEEVFEPPNISWGSASFASPQTSIIYLDLQKHTLFCAFEFVLVIMKSVRLIMFCSSRIVANKGACRHFWNVRSFAQMCAFVRKCALAVRPGFALASKLCYYWNVLLSEISARSTCLRAFRQKPAQNSKQPEMNARWKIQVLSSIH